MFDFIRRNDPHGTNHQELQGSDRDYFGVSRVEVSPECPHKPKEMLDRDNPVYWDIVYFCTHLPKSNGIIAKAFEKLEPPSVLKAIDGGLCVPDAPTPYIYYIGPLILEEKEFGDFGEAKDCLSWLDQQPSSSVVFLCFGSRGSFSGAQLKEIADGWEKSGQRFLWVVKKHPLDEKTKQRKEDRFVFGDELERSVRELMES
ncbi:hypothetical protein ACE6H2_005426 [Prunus campanulata]